MITDTQAEDALEYIKRHASEFAKAKAERSYLESFLKSKKALLMKECSDSPVNAQEREAYAHPEYISLLEGLKQAVELEESLKWKISAAEIQIDIWRTQESTKRAMVKV